MRYQQLPDGVALSISPELEIGHNGPTLRDRLEDEGLPPVVVARIAVLVDDEAERLAFHLAGGVIRRVFIHLSGSNTAMAAVTHALGLTDKNITELGAQLGISKQAIGNMVSRLSPMLGPLSATKAGTHTTLRPKWRGEWLTLQEAAKLSGQSQRRIGDAAIEGKLSRRFYHGRAFFNERLLLKWSADITINSAAQNQRNEPILEAE